MLRSEAVNLLTNLFDDSSYLEVGVNQGETFFMVNAAKKVAVDPKFLFNVGEAQSLYSNSQFFEISSDEYFQKLEIGNDKFDVIYLDGLHTFEQTLRDFTNAITFLSTGGVILIDDVKPNSYDASLASQKDAFALKQYLGTTDGSWMGDTFKLAYFIDAFFPSWRFATIAENHGQAVVWQGLSIRKDAPSVRVGEIACMEYVDLVKSIERLSIKNMADILHEVSLSTRG
jgi:hypothetical protein